MSGRSTLLGSQLYWRADKACHESTPKSARPLRGIQYNSGYLLDWPATLAAEQSVVIESVMKVLVKSINRTWMWEAVSRIAAIDTIHTAMIVTPGGRWSAWCWPHASFLSASWLIPAVISCCSYRERSSLRLQIGKKGIRPGKVAGRHLFTQVFARIKVTQAVIWGSSASMMRNGARKTRDQILIDWFCACCWLLGRQSTWLNGFHSHSIRNTSSATTGRV